MEPLLFSGWNSLFRTVVMGGLAYVVLIFFLRISGKRTLSKMNAFDFIVTIALGSTLATVNSEVRTRSVRLVPPSLAIPMKQGHTPGLSCVPLTSKPPPCAQINQKSPLNPRRLLFS